MSINVVVVSGNLTRNPEKRGSQDNPILSFGIACNERRKNGDEWVDVPQFFDCTIFGKRAIALSSILKKGMAVTVNGRLHYSAWEKDGSKRSKVDITVTDVVLPPKGSKSEDAPSWE